MPLDSSQSTLTLPNGLTINVIGLAYDVDGTPAGFDSLTVGSLLFHSMEELEEGVSFALYADVWMELAWEASRIRAEDKANITELRRWLDKRRNG